LCGASVVPARGTTHSAPGRFRASCGPPLRALRGVQPLDWDRSGRVTPAPTASGSASGRGIVTDRRSGHVPGSLAWSRAPRAKARASEPRWNADRRAHPQDARPCQLHGRSEASVCRRSASLFSFVLRSFGPSVRPVPLCSLLPGLTRQSMRRVRCTNGWLRPVESRHGPPGQARW
jgi:hypothetical protein